MPEMELADDGLIPPTFITVEEAAKNIRKDAQYVFSKGLKRGLSFYAKPELAGYEAILIPEIDDSPLPNNFGTSRRLLPKSGRYDFVKIPSDSIKSIIHVKKSIKLKLCELATHHSIDQPCEGFKWFVNMNALQISEHEILVKASDVSLYFSPIGNTIEIINKITDPVNKAYNAIKRNNLNNYRELISKSIVNVNSEVEDEIDEQSRVSEETSLGATKIPDCEARIFSYFDIQKLEKFFAAMVEQGWLANGSDKLVRKRFTTDDILKTRVPPNTTLFDWLDNNAKLKHMICKEILGISARYVISHFLLKGKEIKKSTLDSGGHGTDYEDKQAVDELARISLLK